MAIGSQNKDDPIWHAKIVFATGDSMLGKCHAATRNDAQETFARMYYTGRVEKIWQPAPDFIKQLRREGKLK